MKPLEILCARPRGVDATPAAILASSAFAMPCRLGDEPAALCLNAVRPSDTLALSVCFGDEPHTLALARSSRFAELDAIWDVRADVPDVLLLALVERACGPLFQLLENAVRRQMRLVGLAGATAADAAALSFRVADVAFTLSRSDTLVAALGTLRNLDPADATLRAVALSAEAEYAAFALSDADGAGLAPGDAVLLPELGACTPRLVVDGRFVADATGVVPYRETADGDVRPPVRVRAARPSTLTLGELFDAAEGGLRPDGIAALADADALRLVRDGRTLATGSLGRVGDQAAFIVETKE